MIATAGAVIVFSTFEGSRCGLIRSFAAGVLRKAIRAGEQFALVGPKRIRSYTAISNALLTGLSSHLFWLRALRKIVSSASSLTACCMRASKVESRDLR